MSEYIKTENYEVFIAKIAREVHGLKHRKLRKRKQRGRKLRGYGVSDFTPTPLKTQSICSFDTP